MTLWTLGLTLSPLRTLSLNGKNFDESIERLNKGWQMIKWPKKDFCVNWEDATLHWEWLRERSENVLKKVSENKNTAPSFHMVAFQRWCCWCSVIAASRSRSFFSFSFFDFLLLSFTSNSTSGHLLGSIKNPLKSRLLSFVSHQQYGVKFHFTRINLLLRSENACCCCCRWDITFVKCFPFAVSVV